MKIKSNIALKWLKIVKWQVMFSLLLVSNLMLTRNLYSQTIPLKSTSCVFGNFCVLVPVGWNSFSNSEKADARSGFASDLAPGLSQYVKTGQPAPKMGDFEVFQKPSDAQLIGWTLLIPKQTDFLKEILKSEQDKIDKGKSQSGGQIKSGICRLVKISGFDVVRVDVEKANGGKTTNFHFWSSKSPGVITTLMIGLRPNKSVQTEKEYQSIIQSLIVSEEIEK